MAPGPLLGGALDRSHSTGRDEPRRRNCPWLTAPGSPHIRQPPWVLPSQPFSGLPAAAGIPPGLARPLCRTLCTVHLPQDAACRQGSSPLDSPIPPNGLPPLLPQALLTPGARKALPSVRGPGSLPTSRLPAPIPRRPSLCGLLTRPGSPATTLLSVHSPLLACGAPWQLLGKRALL